ncbi:hypothetical protein SLEP1_g39779 [Rubroshorea leprosula]|uniref:Uncharacterized protein n=1 Tax=Rubroshorea leprosula TaxID=152421 RepID=A0AAV5L1B7_9ROSI|nr:hypothetical protein SLEP1_g39779 [Rubroshorea leprosula]
MPGFGGTQHAWVWFLANPGARFTGFTSGAGFAGFTSGARFAGFMSGAGFAFGAGLASGFGSLRTQALGLQGTQACWVRFWMKKALLQVLGVGFDAGFGLSILNARFLQVLGSFAGAGFEIELSRRWV